MPTAVTWNVTVVFQKATMNDADAAEVLEALADLRPVLVVAEEEAGYATRYTLTVHPEESSLRQAIATGLRRVEDATGERAQGVEALPQRDVVRQLQRSTIPQLVGNADIADMLGVTRQRAGQLADVDGFPPAVMTIKAGPLRVRDQVEDWARTWNRKAGRPKKTSTLPVPRS